SGRLPLEEAQDAAKRAIRAMRWGDGDYYGVYRYDGLTLVHGNPKNEGIVRLDVKDPDGKLIVKDLIDTARHGGGFFEYSVPRAAITTSRSRSPTAPTRSAGSRAASRCSRPECSTRSVCAASRRRRRRAPRPSRRRP